jgi:membrane-bound inhibitor of C-type lysozyme
MHLHGPLCTPAIAGRIADKLSTAEGLALEDEMIWQKAAPALMAGFLAWASPASAQTFESYRCADGTRFVLAFFPYDRRAFMQIDGHAVTLRRRLALSGRRYSGSGVSLVLTDAGTWIRYIGRPMTACMLW